MEPKRAAAADDRLSSLPVVLQDEILVRLDLRDAVRTAALSRAWRDLWKSLSVISLSFPLGTHPSVVDSVLLPLQHLRRRRVCRPHRRLASIHMSGQLTDHFNLHSSIFSFGGLMSLRLVCCNIPPLPVGFAGFPALQKLDLNSVDFPDNGENQLEAIIRRSPLLHALDLSDVFIPDDCPDSVIEAPNLRSLTSV
jgi:hypothetical protein